MSGGTRGLDFSLRPVRPEDAAQINAIRRSPGLENLLALPSERLVGTQQFLQSLGPNDHHFVAVTREAGEERVIGLAGLTVNASPRLRHSAALGIVIHPDYRGMGVGTKLMEALLDIADNWLMLVRVELGVYPDNERAVRLYQKFGFESEGVKRMAAIRNGAYTDELMMARIREQP